MRTADFDYHLPPKLIAQAPASRRDQSRLLVLHRDSGRIEHRQFPNLTDYLRAGDVLVLNDSRVIPARLRGGNARTNGHFEILLLEENTVNDWWVMLRPGRRARVGTEINILPGRSQSDETHISQSFPAGVHNVRATVVETNDEGHRRLRFSGTCDIVEALDMLGEVPLPPYITPDPARASQDRERYQTVYARPAGSVAAPTAGLHFTEGLLDGIRARGVQICFVTLHVGLGTFAPVKVETLVAHRMHQERFVISEETAHAIEDAKKSGRRIVAVGTTSVRVLESVAAANAGRLAAGSGRTRIFIHPPYDFRIVDALLTNFHLPRSTLLMLASAFAAPNDTRGREMVLAAYGEAVRERYRFFSYGDAMLML
jgi:S-adenosylmethionine:tRNA ribosyltransferase-isomerase